MKKLALMLISALGLASAQTQSPFVDVPPCHWAAEAVGQIATGPAVAPAGAERSAYLVQNSLRQVLEGLRCKNPDWSRGFLQNPSPAFGSGPELSGFNLTTSEVRISGNSAALRFNLTVSLGSSTLTRSGQARLSFGNGRWQVNYADLTALRLPIFPVGARTESPGRTF